VPEIHDAVHATIKRVPVALFRGRRFKVGDALFEVGAAIAAQIGGLDKVPPTARKNQRCGPQGEVPCIFNEFRQQGSSSMVAGLSVRL